MRKHGWHLPYHPLQVVAVAVFLALGFAFYVFFVPFVGKKVFQYVVMGLYSPLITCVFCLYIWCAAADPADPGVFKSKKYVNIMDHGNHNQLNESKLEGESTSPIHDADTSMIGEKPLDETVVGMDVLGEHPTNKIEKKNALSPRSSCCLVLLGLYPSSFFSNCSRQHKELREQQMSEDGMFYCTLCEVEVFKYSKHCRVCDKCVDNFDHHCRWLNNCIGKKNYYQFFTLLVSALLLLILQCSVGILLMICCFLERKRFSVEITSKLGSSFSVIPFVVVVASCTILAMIATLPLAQLFFFHVLLIKKGISTYDYIIALREQEQLVGGQQSPQMSLASSLTVLSSASSFNAFHRGAWCTPPRLFLEDQFDVVPPDARMSVSSSGRRIEGEEPIRKKNSRTVKINPWTLAQLDANEVSKVASEARKKSKVLQPVARHDVPLGLETYSRPENRRRHSKRIRLPADLPLVPLAKIPAKTSDSLHNDLIAETSTSLAPLQLEARNAFHTSQALSTSASVIASSPEGSLDSHDAHPFRISSEVEEGRRLTALSAGGAQKGIPLSRSMSDGYEASGGEDSDGAPSRTLHRSTNWSNVFSSGHNETAVKSMGSSSWNQTNIKL